MRATLQNAASIAGLLITTEAMVAERPKKESGPPGNSWRWHGRYGWTIKPTLKRNDESPEFFRAFFLCRSHGRVMLPNYSLFFFAKIAFQLSLQALAGEAEELYTHDGQLSHAPLMRFLRIAEGLNTMTRRGEIGTSLPVLGLRPTR